MASSPHVLIVGGGLAGALATLALRAKAVRVTLVEPGVIGGNHVWSFFASDIDAAGAALVDPLVGHRWDGGYDVAFPRHRRHLDQPYRSIESEALDAAVRASGCEIVRGEARELTPTTVTLADRRRLDADAVIDARGLLEAPLGLDCGWQKFVGIALDIPEGHGVTSPMVMDATVDQADGYRFVYLLPFSPTRLFVEDTYYCDTPDLDRTKLAGRIADYAAAKGWRVATSSREEVGVLPVVMDGHFGAFWPTADPVARIGVRGALFHPLTSYSLPDAVRTAVWLANQAPLDATLGCVARERAETHWRKGCFDRLLARMLFRAADPPERYRVLERFYRLPEALIARFYAGQSTALDRVRILAGKPPVKLGRAIRAMRG